MMATALAAASVDGWNNIHDRDCPLHLEQRQQPLTALTIATMLAAAPCTTRVDAPLDELAEQLADIPKDLRDDVLDLARRFAALMDVDAVRIRLEGIIGNACTRFHADCTDVRLITTYAGRGTDYLPDGAAEHWMKRVPCGWIALFKGDEYAKGHTPCLHRSPPIAGTGERRLVLVIDTPIKSPD